MNNVRSIVLAGCLMAGCITAPAASLRNIHTFGVMTNASGYNSRSPLVQDTDGTLYGVMYGGGGQSGGTVFKVSTDGTGFAVLHNFAIGDGAYPESGLVLAGGALYGTTTYGCSGGAGGVFRVNTDGSGFTNLYGFSAESDQGVNGDGAYPLGQLTLSGSTLYGTTALGGPSGYGTVFKINTDGTGFISLYSFTGGGDGGQPDAGVVVSGNILYVPTEGGGLDFEGTVFKINTDGSNPTVLYNFTGGGDGSGFKASLVLSGTNLYGVAAEGGTFGFGTIFQINTAGMFFTNLYSFTGGSDGAAPVSALTLSSGVFYGTTVRGGDGVGTVFKISTNGTGFATLHSFSALSASRTNGDGAFPFSGVIFSGGTLYGLTETGGSEVGGTLFEASTNGTSFTNLLNFSGSVDGGFSTATLLASGNALYGNADRGGSGFSGTIFRVNTDGSDFTNLYSFSPTSVTLAGINPDGAAPNDLLLAGNTLFGTAFEGGSLGNGTIFKLNTDGTGFMTLYNFDGLGDGVGPLAGLVLSGNTLYGTTIAGGLNGAGGVFRINTDSSGYTNLYGFTLESVSLHATNSDGNMPLGRLLLVGDALYGTTSQGGLGGGGSVFKLNTDGSDFTNLYSFTVLSDSGTNNDGSDPVAGLILVGDKFYGTTSAGGFYGNGTLFMLDIKSNAFVPLHEFTGGSDGAQPKAALYFSGDTLYGTTVHGGSGGNGTVFQLSTNGSGFRTLYSFSPRSLPNLGTNDTGALPGASVVLVGHTLYGTTFEGGTFGEGNIFGVDLTPLLSIRLISNAVVLSWDDPTFALQSAPAVAGIYETISGATSPHTNAIASPQKLFRLQGN